MSDIREIVRKRYGQAVQGVLEGKRSSCCGASAQATDLERIDPITRDLYDDKQAL